VPADRTVAAIPSLDATVPMTSSMAALVCAGAQWIIVGGIGAFVGETSSPVRAMKIALAILPAGLWMLLPVVYWVGVGDSHKVMVGH
jgi:hypothetical protein